MPRIGVFDSGLGGLTVLKAVRQALPGADYVYLGDTARTPYGAKGRETIVRYARQCAGFLLEHEIDLLIVACNTASSLALTELEIECRCPVIGTIQPAVLDCASAWQGGQIGVIGTRATIASGVYERKLREALPGAGVLSIPCPLFVPLVEEGIFAGEIVQRVAELYLAPFKQRPLEALILACTHYPLLKTVLSAYLGPNLRIIDSASAIAVEARKIIGRDLPPGQGAGTARYFVTDDPSRFNYLASELVSEEVQAIRVEDW